MYASHTTRIWRALLTYRVLVKADHVAHGCVMRVWRRPASWYPAGRVKAAQVRTISIEGAKSMAIKRLDLVL